MLKHKKLNIFFSFALSQYDFNPSQEGLKYQAFVLIEPIIHW